MKKNAYTYQLMGLRIDSLYRQWLKFTTTIKRPKQKKTKQSDHVTDVLIIINQGPV